MATNLIARNASNVEITSIALTSNRGASGSAVVVRVFNDDSPGGIDDAAAPFLEYRQVDQSSGEAVLSGLRAIDERWLQARATGTNSTGASHDATAWQSVGRGRPLRLSEIPAGEWIETEVRYAPPASAPAGEIVILIAADDGNAVTALEQGHTESERDGVLSGVGDGEWSERIVGADVAPNDPADDGVVIADEVWRHKGVILSKLTHEVTLSNLDGSAAALVAGEAYWAVLSLGSTTTVTVTKSAKDTEPLDTADIPEAPAGEIALARVTRGFDAQINAGDIVMLSDVGGFALEDLGNLTPRVGPGRAIVDNGLITRGNGGPVTLIDNDDNTLWLMPDGTLVVNVDGSRPDPRARRIYGLGTVSGAIVTITDYRDRIGGRRVTLHFAWEGALDGTGGAKRHAHLPCLVDSYVMLPRGIVFAIHSQGSGVYTGRYRVEIRFGGTTIFTSSGSDDRRPTIAFDDSPALDDSALPEVVEAGPLELIECELIEDEAYDVSGPSSATLTISFEVP